jgi:hypothetical protein
MCVLLFRLFLRVSGCLLSFSSVSVFSGAVFFSAGGSARTAAGTPDDSRAGVRAREWCQWYSGGLIASRHAEGDPNERGRQADGQADWGRRKKSERASGG